MSLKYYIERTTSIVPLPNRVSAVWSLGFFEHSNLDFMFYYHFVDLEKFYSQRKNDDGIRCDTQNHTDHTILITDFFSKNFNSMVPRIFRAQQFGLNVLLSFCRS